ncbi:hypothetical protein BBJ28_00025385, partial [Nothophytophthora sp. Chile5]
APLDEESVWDLPEDDKARPLQVKFDAAWAKHTTAGSGESSSCPNVALLLWQATKGSFTVAFVLLAASATLTLLQPFIIRAILKNLTGEDNNMFGLTSGYALAGLLGCVAVVGTTANNAGHFLMTRAGCNARMISINSTYQKLLRMSGSAKRSMTSGEVMTLVGVDSERITDAFKLVLWALISPAMQLAVSLLTATQLGIYAGIAFAIASVVIVYSAVTASRRIGAYRVQISKISANRVKLTREVLLGVRVLKFYGWEHSISHVIQEIREREVALMRRYNHLRVANAVLMLLAPTLLNLICFSIYVWSGKTLDVGTAFLVIGLTNACKTPYSIFGDALVAVSEARIATRRLSAFLMAAEVHASLDRDLSSSVSPVISIRDGVFSHTEDASSPTLSGINLTLTPGSLTVVVGATGSGKSSLVNAILGEMQHVSGVRDNGSRGRYRGRRTWQQPQRWPEARVSVARALYRAQNADFLVLDDPLSALDVHVANKVFTDGVLGIAKGKTRLLVLNSHYHLLPFADRVVVMKNGRIAGDGTMDELTTQFPSLVMTPPRKKTLEEDIADIQTHERSGQQRVSAAVVVSQKRESPESSNAAKTILKPMIKAEKSRVGAVEMQTYVAYFTASGWNGYLVAGGIAGLFTLTQVLLFFCDWFVSQWSEGAFMLSAANYMAVYATLVLFTSAMACLRFVAFMNICMSASAKLHAKYLRKVLCAPVGEFFDVTPVGRILNRFSRDLDQVDNALPFFSLIVTLYIFQFGSTIVVCAVALPYIMILYTPVGYVLLFTAKAYQASARELKRLDSVTRSSFLNLVSETLSGVESIRSFKATATFSARGEKLLNHNATFYFHFLTSSGWFSVRTDWLVGVLIGVVATLSVALKSSVGAAAAGLAMTYMTQLTSSLQRLTTLGTKLESVVTCFERLAEYDLLNEEGCMTVASNKDALARDWPRTGSVTFQNVSMRYSDELGLVLKDVSFSVASGEKVGICGRTGSGKSSLVNVLFRGTECSSGRVLLDGMDIASITVHQLRAKLTIIPQDPMLFSGSLRLNLDPFAEKSDADLWEVLRKVHLSDSVAVW